MSNRRTAAQRYRFHRRVSRLLWRIAVGVAVLCFALACLVTYGGGNRGIPTWDQVYAAVGFHTESHGQAECRLDVMDVGNCDCLLFCCGDQSLLVDGATVQEAERVSAVIARRGVSRLDYVIVTHTDVDHIGGLMCLLETVKVGTVLVPNFPSNYQAPTAYRQLTAWLECHGIMQLTARRGMHFSLGPAEAEILSDTPHTDDNDQSVVCRIRLGNERLLLMGDAGETVEKELLSSGVDLSADVLKVAHHGSKTSSTLPFLQAVSPKIAIISCGADNAYGHPHIEVLDNLRKVGAAVYRTDIHGTVTVTATAATAEVSTERRPD